LFEPISSFGNRSVFVATAIVTPTCNKIPVNLLNMTDKRLTIYKNCRLGQVRILPKPVKAMALSSINTVVGESPVVCITDIQGNPKHADAERDIGSTNLITHLIETGNNVPIK